MQTSTRPPLPYGFINLVGDGHLRGTTLVLPTERVRHMLPHGLDLGEQQLTPKGTHPVVIFFYDMYRAHMTVPTLLPNMTYHENIVGIPFAYTTPGFLEPYYAGPFFFMPRLNLDNYLATVGGILWWGFAKHLSKITTTEDSYAVATLGGDPLISLDIKQKGELKPVDGYPYFEPMRQIMDQPIVSQLPVGMGPLFACSNFDKKWDTALVRPLSTEVQIDQCFVSALPTGRFAAEGIDADPLGSFEVQSRWRQSLIYPCAMHAKY
jgi:hypothetical protein